MNNLGYHASELSRRTWLQTSSFALAGICLPKSMQAFAGNPLPYKYLLAKVTAPLVILPVDKSIPFDWPVAEIAPNSNPVHFYWHAKSSVVYKQFRFRITSATDVREVCKLELRLTKSGALLGTMNVQYAHYMQPFEYEVETHQVDDLLNQGISVTMSAGTKPFWFFMQAEKANDVPEAYLPHILISNGTAAKDAWESRLLSGASLSTFGWMEGCVVDGIGMLAKQDKNAHKILDKHLDAYFANSTLIYESYSNTRKEKEINNVESILPFALLAKRFPQHPMLETAIQFCMDHADSNGVIADEKGDNRNLKTEECYTIAYPLAMLSKTLNRPRLQEMAIANLKARVELLYRDGTIFQHGKEKEKPGYGNWARGVAWYMLGLVKTLALLPDDSNTAQLKQALVDATEMVMQHQQPSGLWHCFIHQPETGMETSGSAAIGAALAFGHANNLLPDSCKMAAQKCMTGLQPWFTPDGYLTGTAQVNKGGEALQRNGFRVISPYTLGFIGILHASLKT